MSFDKLKKSSQQSLENLANAMEKLGKKNYEDDRLWKPTPDKSGNAYAKIRFLDISEADEKGNHDALPWVQYHSHGFKGPGGWLIDNCLTSHNQPCPVCESNTQLWNAGRKDLISGDNGRKRKLHYISNILVLKDPMNPENEGKVFLFKYGVKIFEKIQAKLAPRYADQQSVNVFNYWNGANFNLRTNKGSKGYNYDNCDFDPQGPLYTKIDDKGNTVADDDKLKKVYDSQYSLADFIRNLPMKSYADLKKRLLQVEGAPSSTYTKSAEDYETESESHSDTTTSSSPPFEEDDNMSYFSQLAGD